MSNIADMTTEQLQTWLDQLREAIDEASRMSGDAPRSLVFRAADIRAELQRRGSAVVRDRRA